MAMRGMTTDDKTSLDLLKYQVDLFKKVANVMSKVDLPKDFWDKTLAKMEQELESLM